MRESEPMMVIGYILLGGAIAMLGMILYFAS